jgi:hypothetical protein
LYVRYSDIIPNSVRRTIERETVWAHLLVPQIEVEGDAEGSNSEWQGRLAAIEKMIVRQGRKTAKVIKESQMGKG